MSTITKRTWTTKTGEAREAWSLAFTDNNGKRHKKLFPKKRDADAARIALEGQVSTGSFRESASKTTVADACKLYLDHLKARHLRDAKVTTTYLETNRGEVWNYIAQSLKPDGHDKSASRVTPFSDGVGHLKLSRFTPVDVDDWADRLLAEKVSVPTVRRLIATLSRALSHAVSKNLVGVNAAKGVKVVGSRKDDAPKKVLPPTKQAMRTLLAAAPPDTRIRLLFAAASGLRASEQWALRWRHLNLFLNEVSGSVTVETRVDIHGVEDTTKSNAGRRVVPIGKSLVTALKAWRARSPYSSDDDLVFPGFGGSYVRHGNMLKREFNPLKTSVGHPALTWHALRHYAVSTWIDIGLKPKAIQEFAGHATLAITMDRYGHLFPSDDHGAAMDLLADDLMLQPT